MRGFRLALLGAASSAASIASIVDSIRLTPVPPEPDPAKPNLRVGRHGEMPIPSGQRHKVKKYKRKK